MTNLITLTIPNDDHIALRAFGKALEEMALAREPQQITTDATLAMEHLHAATVQLAEAAPRMMLRCEGDELQGKRKEPEIDTTTQQVESLSSMTDEELDEFCPPPTTDSTGTPWDERIHSTSKALNADGTWRLRRKPKDMDEAEWAATVQRVQDELRFPQEPVTVTPVMTDEEVKAFDDVEPPVTPPGDDFHTDVGVLTEQTVAGIPPIPVPPPVMVPPVNTGVYQGGAGTVGSGATGVEQDYTFPKLMTFLTERQGRIDVATVNMLLAQDGIASLPELNAHPDKIGPFVARVKAHLGE